MEEIASVYARSLFEVARDAGSLDTVREQLGEIADALDGNRDLTIFFFSPYFSGDEKKSGLHRLVTGADATLVNFLELLIENHRLPAIFRIRRSLDRLWEEENKLLPVQVTTAIELDAQVVEELGRKIGEQTGRRVQLSSTVDPEILGGIVLRVGNNILDASIRNRLDQLRRQVAKA